MNHYLIAAAVLTAWVLSLYVRPFGRCIRCHGKRVIIRGKPTRSRKPPRPVACPLCKGAGRRQRFGSRSVHRLARRVSRELDRQRQQRATLTTPKE